MNTKHLARTSSVAISLLLTVASTQAHAEFAMGADVSWLPRSEARGVKYYDANGVAGDCLAIMKAQGINSIRLRTWINPNMNDDFSGHCSQAETIAMAMRCKKLGLRVMIDFHYHNTWVSVGKPATPKEWVGMTYAQMQTALYNYAYGFCTALRDSGVTPEWFQNGNETNGGLCVPTGAVSNPVQMTGLLNKGYDAIHAVFPLPKTKVMLHVAQPQNTAGAAMVTAFLKNGGKMDALGWSSYAGSGNVDGLVTAVKAWHDNNFKMETFMVEIGSSEAAAKQQITIEHWNAGINAMNKPCEGGTFYWEPEAYSAPGNWADNNFPGGKPNSSYAAYKVPLKTPCTVDLRPSTSPKVVEKATLSRTTNRGLLLHKSGQFQFKAYDLTGRCIGSGSAMDVADLGADLKTGLYLVDVQSADGNQVLQAVQY